METNLNLVITVWSNQGDIYDISSCSLSNILQHALSISHSVRRIEKDTVTLVSIANWQSIVVTNIN